MTGGHPKYYGITLTFPPPDDLSGIMDCIRQIISRDGYLGLYRGLGPNMLKAVPSISISYAVFETCSTYFHGMVI